MTAGCPNRQRRHTPSSWTTPNPDTTLLGLYFQQPARVKNDPLRTSDVQCNRCCRMIVRQLADRREINRLKPLDFDFATVSQLAHYHSATTVALHIRGPQWVIFYPRPSQHAPAFGLLLI